MAQQHLLYIRCVVVARVPVRVSMGSGRRHRNERMWVCIKWTHALVECFHNQTCLHEEHTCLRFVCALARRPASCYYLRPQWSRSCGATLHHFRPYTTIQPMLDTCIRWIVIHMLDTCIRKNLWPDMFLEFNTDLRIYRSFLLFLHHHIITWCVDFHV